MRYNHGKKKRDSIKKEDTEQAHIFAAEGHNATETLYLKDLIKNLKGVVFRKAHGNETDPVGMVENLIASMDAYGFDSDYGDFAFCFVDFDRNKEKEQQIREALNLASSNNIHLIISNPCFELWYICHFTSSPKNNLKSKDLSNDMSSYIKGYTKSMEAIYSVIKNETDTAIRNAEQLEKRAIEKGYVPYTADFSPATDVYRIFQLIPEIKEFGSKSFNV